MRLVGLTELVGLVVVAIAGPGLLSYLQTRARRAERALDWERRQADTAAEHARQDDVARKAEEARLDLIHQNEVVAETAALAAQTADRTERAVAVVHTLVNSDMTKAKQAQLDAELRVRTLLNAQPDARGDELAAVEGRIADLRAELAQRQRAANEVIAEGA